MTEFWNPTDGGDSVMGEIGRNAVVVLDRIATGRPWGAGLSSQVDHGEVDLAAVGTPRGDGGAGDRAEASGEAIGDVLGPVVVGEYTELGEPVAGVLVGVAIDGAGR